MPTYSFGEDSPLKFEISDKLAFRYNQAVAEFFKAQQRFNQKFGRRWNPRTQPIELRWTNRQQKAWNEFNKILKATIDREGPVDANEIMDDFLIKNTAEMISKGSDRYARVLTLAVGASVLYVLLRARNGY